MATVSGASISLQVAQILNASHNFFRAKNYKPPLATARISGFNSVSLFSHIRSNLSFNLRPVPARLTVSCTAKQETVEKVCKIVKKQLSLAEGSPITPETKFSDLGADSLDTVEIVMGLEEEFGITMAEDRAQKIATVEQAAKLIEELVKEKSA